MGRFMIAAYRPKPGMAAALQAVMNKHWPMLREQALVTERPAQRMRAADGTVVEVFEWLSPRSIERARHNAAVQALRAEFAAVCDPVVLAQLAEASQVPAEFDAL